MNKSSNSNIFNSTLYSVLDVLYIFLSKIYRSKVCASLTKFMKSSFTNYSFFQLSRLRQLRICILRKRITICLSVLISVSTEFSLLLAQVFSHSSSLLSKNSMLIKIFIRGVCSALKQVIMQLARNILSFNNGFSYQSLIMMSLRRISKACIGGRTNLTSSGKGEW